MSVTSDSAEAVRLSPRPHTVLRAGDRLIVVAPEPQIERLKREA